MIGLLVTIGGVLFSNSLTTLQARDTALDQRVATLEVQNANQQSELSALHIQLDTINQRGSTGADTRLNSLDTRVQVLDTRETTIEARVSRLEANGAR